MKTNILVSALLALSALVAGCGPESESQLDEGKKEEVQKESYTEALQSEDGSVRLIKYVPGSLEQDAQRAKYMQSDLVPMPALSTDNTFSLFRMNNNTDYEGTVFIAPKVYVYGSNDNVRTTPKVNSNGSITINFPVILATGLNKQVPGVDGKSQITLPSNYVIENKQAFLQEVTQHASYAGKGIKNLAPIPGCPKKVTIAVGSFEYDATPSAFKSGDHCQTEAPFTVSVTMDEIEARNFLEKDLYNDNATLYVAFETKANITQSKYEISFDKAKVFESLKAKLEINHPYASAEIHRAVTEVMQNQVAKINMVGEITDQMSLITGKAIELFFEQMRPDPSHPNFKECQSIGCLSLSMNSLKDERSFSVSWLKSKAEQTGQNYLTSTPLKANGNETQLGRVHQVKVNEDGKEVLKSVQLIPSGQSVETGMTVEAGDLLAISPKGIAIDEVQPQGVARPTVHNNVCIEWGMRAVPVFNPDMPSHREFEEYCKTSEDQKIDVTDHGLIAIGQTYETNPVGKLEQLFEGLLLKFTWRDESGQKREATCPLGQFQRYGDGRSLIVRINNQPGCNVFSGKNQQSPMLHIVNNIKFNRTYNKGTVTKYWHGGVESALTPTVYSPAVHFEGSVMIRGYQIEAMANYSKKL